MPTPDRPDAWQSSEAPGPVRSAGRGPWIIAGAVIAAALLLSLTLVALRHDKTAADTAAEGGSSSVDQDLAALTAAQDRAAQSDLRNVLVAAKTIYTDASSYAGADASTTGLSLVEPSLCYVSESVVSVAADPTSCTPISVYAASATTWSAARMSSSGTCFWVKDDAAVGTTYGSGSPCTGTAAMQAASNSW